MQVVEQEDRSDRKNYSITPAGQAELHQWLVADASSCANCKRCTINCPMSLDVNAMVQLENMENTECILCGTCVDNCAKSAIHYAFNAGK